MLDIKQENKQERKIPQPLPSSMDWTKGPPTQKPVSKPFTKEEDAKLEEHLKEIEANSPSSPYFKMGEEEIEVVFVTDDPRVGMKERVITDKNGKEIVIKKFNFVLYNCKLGREQEWEASNTAATTAIAMMRRYGNKNLIVKRTGLGMSDTKYEFFPVMLKAAADL